MRVTHVITDLGVGGAPVMLDGLVRGLAARGTASTVIALGGMHPRFASLESAGVQVHTLGMTARVSALGALVTLRRLLAASRPDVVHAWMYHASLLGGLAARSLGAVPIVWGLHHTPSPGEHFKPLTRLAIAVGARLSDRLPARIVCCAEAARLAHARRGYADSRMEVIVNGFDVVRFAPDPQARHSLRQELGLGPDTPLVAVAGRFHPQKDHRTFIRAAGQLAQRLPSVRFVMAGTNVNSRNQAIRQWLAESGVADRTYCLGIREDMPRLMAACDVFTSSASYGEAFPLVLGEAMACGVPCVATDVGDSSVLVGDTGVIVEPGRPEVLAAAWAELLGLPAERRRELGEAARRRVTTRFGLDSCVERHLALYAGLISPAGRAEPA